MRITINQIREMKDKGEKISMLTAYDYSTARIVDEAGIPLILVGDSLGMVVLGYESTIPVTMDEKHQPEHLISWLVLECQLNQHRYSELHFALGATLFQILPGR